MATEPSIFEKKDTNNIDFSNVDIDKDFVINYILPSIVDNDNFKFINFIEQCNSLEEVGEFKECYDVLKKFLDYVMYVKNLYDKKEAKLRTIKFNKIENLLFVHNYLSLFVPYNKNLISVYWNKKYYNKNYIVYCIVLNLAFYIFDLISSST